MSSSSTESRTSTKIYLSRLSSCGLRIIKYSNKNNDNTIWNHETLFKIQCVSFNGKRFVQLYPTVKVLNKVSSCNGGSLVELIHKSKSLVEPTRKHNVPVQRRNVLSDTLQLTDIQRSFHRWKTHRVIT